MHTEKVSTSTSTSSNENRKSSKPIMEKRRRARMNASLAELKALLLEFMKKEGNRHSKMEKADILEMTVKQLRHLQRQNFSASANEDTSLLTKYVLGFQECASEVSRYLSSMSEVEPDIRTRLLNHLATYITSSPSFSNSSSPKRHSSSPPSPCLSTKATGNRPLSESEVSSSPSPDRVATSSSNSPPPLSTSSQSPQILLTKVPASCQLERPTSNEATSSDSKQVASSTIANVTGLTNGILTLDPSLSHIQASKVGASGGLQLLATKMPTCQVAFVLPASVMTDDSLHALQAQQNYFPVPIYAPTSQTTLASLTGSTGSSTGAMMTLLPEVTKPNIGVAPLSNMSTLPQIISFPGALPSSGPQILLNGTEIYKEFETPSKHNALISTPEMKKSLSPPASIGKELSRNHHQRHQHPYHHIRGDRDTPALRINEDENVWRPW